MKTVFSHPGSKLKTAALDEILGHVFCYHRVGFDRRWMSFNADGRVGLGARAREIHWRLLIDNGHPVLDFASEEGVTCRLKRQRDGIWRGKWIVCEQMPIELSPAAKITDSLFESFLHPLSPKLMPQSLLVVSLPRSLSTLIYHKVRRAIGLDQPTWTTDGEILNIDRNVLKKGTGEETSCKYLEPLHDSMTFQATSELLDALVFRFGFAYKDVVQPFVVADWLKKHPMPVLRIKRNVADVAHSMLARNWLYPGSLFPNEKDRTRALIQGLMHAERTLNTIDAEVVHFDDLILGERPLDVALRKLYPRSSFEEITFIDDAFNETRRNILQRQNTPGYARLLKYIEELNKEQNSRELKSYFSGKKYKISKPSSTY